MTTKRKKKLHTTEKSFNSLTYFLITKLNCDTISLLSFTLSRNFHFHVHFFNVKINLVWSITLTETCKHNNINKILVANADFCFCECLVDPRHSTRRIWLVGWWRWRQYVSFEIKYFSKRARSRVECTLTQSTDELFWSYDMMGEKAAMRVRAQCLSIF
jgi:hypothetical protein